MSNHIQQIADAIPDMEQRQPSPLAHRPATELVIGGEGVLLRERDSSNEEAYILAEEYDRLEDWR